MIKTIRDGDRLLLEKDGERIIPAAYMTYLDDNNDYSLFASLGYRLFSVACYAGDCPINARTGIGIFKPGFSIKEGVFDFSTLDESIRKILDVRKDALIILRLNLNTPKWWREKYPDELVKPTNGQTYMQSIQSPLWREFGRDVIEKTVQHIFSSDYKDNVIALHLGGMQTEEWIAMAVDGGLLDLSRSFLNYYYSWLKEKYQSIRSLNEVWGENYQSFEEVKLPTVETIHIRDHAADVPSKEYFFLEDYLRAFNDASADTITYFTRYAKSLVKDEMLVGVFYGYIGQLPANFGHCALNKVIEEPSVEFLASPYAYVDSHKGAVDFFYHAPMDSVKKKNKIWFMEADIRTNRTKLLPDSFPELTPTEHTRKELSVPVWKGPETEEESLSILIRCAGKNLVSKNAWWAFDMWGQWYHSPAFADYFDKYLKEFTNLKGENINEIAVILDEEASYEVGYAYFMKMSYVQLRELGFIGTSYDTLRIKDASESLLKRYKALVYILPSNKQRERLNLGDKPGNYVQFNDGAIYSDILITKERLIEVLKEHSVFLYSPGNIVYASSEYISLTSTVNGEVELSLPNKEKLTSIFGTDDCFGQVITKEMKINESILYRRKQQ